MSKIIKCPSCHKDIEIGVIPQSGAVTCADCQKSIILKKSGIIKKSDQLIAEELLSKGFITKGQLDKAFEEQGAQISNGETKPLTTVLLEKNYIKHSALKEILGSEKDSALIDIPGYKISGKLGGGGMGSVYKAVRLSDNQEVAIKILSEKLARRKEFVGRFEREAKVAIGLNHPHIVKGYEVGEAKGTHYFVMEYVHGKSAERVLQKRHKFGEKRSLDICRQIAEALSIAHQKGLVHRDIKPGNIILTKEGYAKLADYGLVKITDNEALVTLTVTGQVMGTPYYISPEQAAGEKEIDIRSDIYSLGATLYHMATGTPPYRGRSGADIMAMHICGNLDNPKDRNPDLSDKAVKIITRMMQTEKSDRYQSPEELIAGINKYFTGDSYRQADHTPKELVAEDEFESGSSDSKLSVIMSEWFSTPAGKIFSDHKRLEKIMIIGIMFGLIFMGIFLGQAISIAKNRNKTKDDTFEKSYIEQLNTLEKISATPDQREKINNLKDFALQHQSTQPGMIANSMIMAHNKSSSSFSEKKALDLWIRSRFLQRDKKISYLSEITENYPSTSVRQKAETELNAIHKQIEKEKKQKALAEEKKRHQEIMAVKNAERAELERTARSEFEIALLLKKTPEEYLEKLKSFLQNKQYESTSAYRKAQNEFKTTTDLIARQKAREEQQASIKEARTRFPNIKQQYIFSLMENNIPKAKAIISGFWESYPQKPARAMARPLMYDITLLDSFETLLLNALGEKTGENVKLKMSSEGTLRGELLRLEKDDGRIMLKISGGQEISRKISGISLEEKHRLIQEDADNKKKKLEAKIISALSFLVERNVKAAEEIFREIKKSDPYAKHHQELIKEFSAF